MTYVEEMIETLKKLKSAKPGTSADLDEDTIIKLCKQAQEVFLAGPMVLELDNPIKILGDLHGQFYDLLRTFELGGYPGTSQYLLLGDYIDRGKQSVETMCLLFALKVLLPDRIHLLRGNHETSQINRIYGFYDECKRRYSVKLYKTFCSTFNCMPVCAVISGTIICMHGGLSPSMESWEDLNKKERPCEIGEEGLLCDIVWADPDRDVTGWEESDRGVSYLFGKDILKGFLDKNDLELLVRAHQVVEDGYEFLFDRQLVTIFSAPNYCGEFDNAGAMLVCDRDMTCSFQVLKPVSSSRRSSACGGSVPAPPELHQSASDKLRDSVKKLITTRRILGHMTDVKDVLSRERNVDRKSYFRKSSGMDGAFSGKLVSFPEDLTTTIEIEDLTRKGTTWGDIWDDLYYDDETLADFKYEAFMETIEDSQEFGYGL